MSRGKVREGDAGRFAKVLFFHAEGSARKVAGKCGKVWRKSLILLAGRCVRMCVYVLHTYPARLTSRRPGILEGPEAARGLNKYQRISNRRPSAGRPHLQFRERYAPARDGNAEFLEAVSRGPDLRKPEIENKASEGA
jgi:hypothetical protein